MGARFQTFRVVSSSRLVRGVVGPIVKGTVVVRVDNLFLKRTMVVSDISAGYRGGLPIAARLKPPGGSLARLLSVSSPMLLSLVSLPWLGLWVFVQSVPGLSLASIVAAHSSLAPAGGLA